MTSAKRIAVAPEVPTFAESGLPGFDVNPWWGVLAPAGIDPAIVSKINTDVAEVLESPEVQKIFHAKGAEIYLTTAQQFHDILVADVAKWAKVVKASGARVD